MILVLYTDDEPEVVRSISIDYDPHAHAFYLHDVVQEPDRIAQKVIDVPEYDMEALGEAILSEARRAVYRDERQGNLV